MINKCEVLILGAGFSGLSTSYHIGHDRCLVLEKTKNLFGHCKSTNKNGAVWDEGPHVSFTENDYVRKLFSDSVKGEYAEYKVNVGNYYKRTWIDHPAQVNLYQVPEPLRSECLESFLLAFDQGEIETDDYGEWLKAAFGHVFSSNFPAAYTRKYWTCEPEELETSWIGRRVHRPGKEDVVKGAVAPLSHKKHYIKKVRYPKVGGYEAFGRGLSVNADVKLNHEVVNIDLQEKIVSCSNGETFKYEKIISTIPMPLFVSLCKQSTKEVIAEAKKLKCTSGYLVNVHVPHKSIRDENWLYVYDEDLLSTRITFVNKLDGVSKSTCMMQVEVYESDYKMLNKTNEEIESLVVQELYKMGLINEKLFNKSGKIESHVTYFKWGNVIFDHNRKNALNIVLNWLTNYGLIREKDDLEPACDWSESNEGVAGEVFLAGRYSQWKYFWSDDCVLRGRQLGDLLSLGLKCCD